MFSFLFGSGGGAGGSGGSSAPAPTKEEAMKEQVRRWTKEIRDQGREIDRQIRQMEREEEKVKREAKDAAKKGNDPRVIKAMAKNIVTTRKAVEKMHTTKAHLNSVMNTISTQSAVARVAGVMGKSTAIMKSMNTLMKIPELSATMRKMGEEMQRAGIIEEMMDDAMDSVDEGVDAEADEVTEQVMYEITQGLMGTAPSAPIAGMGLPAKKVVAPAAAGPKRVAVLEGGEAAGGAGASADSEIASLRDELGKL